MKILSLLFGILLLIGTFVWFSYFVPPGCGMNPTGCHEEFSVWSQIGLIHFWAPLAVSAAAIIYGAGDHKTEAIARHCRGSCDLFERILRAIRCRWQDSIFA